jgi:hypothetical protein
MVQQLSATKCNYIAILRVSLVSFAAITICGASQRVTPKDKRIFRYRLSPETFGYTLVLRLIHSTNPVRFVRSKFGLLPF